MQDQANALPEPKRLPWNKGKLTGAKPPLRSKHIWSIRTKLQIEGRARDLAMFNLAIDSKQPPVTSSKLTRTSSRAEMSHRAFDLCMSKQKLNGRLETFGNFSPRLPVSRGRDFG